MKKTILHYSTFTFACLALPMIAGAAEIQGTQIRQQNGKILIQGSVSRGAPAQQTLGAHVHVDLVNSKGQIVDTAVRSLPVTAPRKDASRNHRASYSVRFDEVSGVKATVRYFNRPHAECVEKTHCGSC